MIKRVIRTDNFIRKLSKLDTSYIDRIEKLVTKIIGQPEVGKPMKHDRKGTREVYAPPFRLSYSYIVSEEKLIFLDIYHKDEQ